MRRTSPKRITTANETPLVWLLTASEVNWIPHLQYMNYTNYLRCQGVCMMGRGFCMETSSCCWINAHCGKCWHWNVLWRIQLLFKGRNISAICCVFLSTCDNGDWHCARDRCVGQMEGKIISAVFFITILNLFQLVKLENNGQTEEGVCSRNWRPFNK